MRFNCSSTYYQRRAGIGYLELALKIQCVLPAFSMRFQREFDKYKNVGGRVVDQEKLETVFDCHLSPAPDFDLRLSIVKSVFHCRLSSVLKG